MDELQIKSIVDAEIRAAIGAYDGEYSFIRADAMDRFYGRPYGNEAEGRSRVLTREVMDTVMWIMPSLLRIFASSDDAVVFEPVGPEDEEAARQETDFVNYTFWQENDGFRVMYSWLFDALLQNNGTLKVYWEEYDEVKRESYQNLTEEEYQYLSQDKSLTEVESESVTSVEMVPDQIGQLLPVESVTYNVTFNRTEKMGRVCIEPLPPEEFLVSNDARSSDPKCARFVAHRTQKTRSELIEMGFKRSDVELMGSYTDTQNSAEYIARNYISDEYTRENESGESNTLIEYIEAYTRIDIDDDGVDELVKVVRAGDYCDWEEVDRVPFVGIVPIMVPHKYIGISIADLVKDLQEIKTTLLRNVLDNIYAANHGRTAVDANNVNLGDLLTSSPLGVVRVNGSPANSIMPMGHMDISEKVLGVMEYVDGISKDRTGVGEGTQGLDADTLMKANTGVMAMNNDSARMKIELIARIVAETGVRCLYQDIHELLQKHQNKEKVVKLRNKWVPILPSEWRERKNVRINVGLGTGSRDQMMMRANKILETQQQIVMSGGMGVLVSPQNIYNALSKLITAAELGEPDEYFTNPSTVPPQAPKPDPQIEAIKVQQQIEMAKMREQHEKELTQAKMDMQKYMADHEVKLTELELKYRQNVPGSLV